MGLTGRSGCGKSTVSRLLRQWGAPVCDADEVAREVLRPGSPCLPALRAAFGDDILDEHGEIIRPQLAARAFQSPDTAARLSAITHPEIIRRILSAADEAGEQGSALFFVDGAVIVGHGLEPYCWRIAVVDADDDTAAGRICARDGISMSAARRRLAAQTPRRVLLDAAHYTIENRAGEAELERAAALFYRQVKEDAHAAQTS